MTILFGLTTLCALIGLLQCLVGWLVVVRFVRRPRAAPAHKPPVTVLRPLCGTEPLLEEALASGLAQDYPSYQIVFGVQNPSDPVLPIAQRLQAEHPDHDITIVVDSALHGPNRKVSNLINMMAAAKHDVLVISDSDLHLPPNYLERLTAELDKPRTGLVTSLYVGLPPHDWGLWERLGATQITHCFLPGVMLSRAFGRQDCLGSTTMLTRETLERVGGFESLVDILAEDNVLGQRVRDLGLSVRLADTVVAATVPEPSWIELWRHETRWMRTIRSLAPYALAASILQYPLFWSALTVVLAGAAWWSVALYFFAWVVRGIAVSGIDGAVRACLGPLLRPIPIGILPLRDVLSVVEIAASYWIEEVTWRGHKIWANGGKGRGTDGPGVGA